MLKSKQKMARVELILMLRKIRREFNDWGTLNIFLIFEFSGFFLRLTEK